MSSAAPPGAEQARLREADAAGVPWRRWGPYLSDRQWGSVREDCNADGDFHGDDGAGLRASHPTGWRGLVAVLPNLFVHLAGRDLLHGAGSTGGRARTDGRRP